MNVLVCGASGFIGRALCAGLAAAGHTVVRGVRRPTASGDIAINYTTDTDPALWAPRLAGIEAVINAVGIIAEKPGSTFEALHGRAPSALFTACADTGVRRVIQISSLGADSGDTGYFRSKYSADRHLMAQPLEWIILRPSLVYGEDGASARAFASMSTLPLIPLPTLPESARLQPVHIDDLVAAVLRALEPDAQTRLCIECTGPTHHSLKELLSGYRTHFRLGPARWLPIPVVAMNSAARVGEWIPGCPLNRDTLRMLRAGNAAPSDRLAEWIGRPPRGLAEFMSLQDAERLRARALDRWQRPLLVGSIGAVWILTGLACLLLYPKAGSLALLAQVGLSGPGALAAFYGSVALDLILGIATIFHPRRIIWLAQMAVILFYSVLIALFLPGWLIHPFGPILKNLPMLALLVVLLSEDPPWTTSR